MTTAHPHPHDNGSALAVRTRRLECCKVALEGQAAGPLDVAAIEGDGGAHVSMYTWTMLVELGMEGSAS